jgi:hypothetical protein
MVFNQAFFRVYSPLTTQWLEQNPTFGPVVGYTGTITIPSADISGGMTASIIPGIDIVLLSGLFQGITVKKLTDMLDIAGPGDLVSSLPEQIKTQIELLEDKLGALELTYAAVDISFNGTSTTIDETDFIINLPLQWHVWDDYFLIDHIACHFFINNPFSSPSLWAIVMGTCEIAGVPVDIVAADLGGYIVSAQLAEGQTIPLRQLMETYVPDVPSPADLTINALGVTISPQRFYAMRAIMADAPHSWVIDVGFQQLTISDVVLDFTYPKGGPVSGSFGGTIAFSDVAKLSMRYDIPGNFVVRGTFPLIKFTEILSKLCNLPLFLPDSFDLTFERSSVLIQKMGENFVFQLATRLEDIGSFALEVRKATGDQWGFALGGDISGLAALPGLSALAPFDSFIGLEALMLVVSSLDAPSGFQFPDFANFNAPSLGNQNIRLPAQASGLTRGLNFYARLSTTNSDGFRALANYLGIALNGTVGITIAVSLPDPLTNSKLFLSVSEEIQKGTTLVGELGGLLQGSDVGVFLTAVVTTQVQSQPLKFTVTAAVLDDGVLISGTVQGTIQFGPVQLSNLALVIGMDFEGIPSLGIAATLDISNFDTALALFFDSADPAKSLLAGAISNVTLLDIAQGLANQQNIPTTLQPVLGLIGLKALNAFSLPPSLATALDNRNLSAIADAFKQYGGVTIPGTSDHMLLVITTNGSQWHLTDLSTMQHYSLSLAGTSIAVTLQPQLYLAPQTTFIGALQYPQGFDITAEIDYLLLQTQIKILINTNQGIAADVDLAPIILLSRDFFSITGSNAQGGPLFSLATYSQPNLTDARLRDPHLLIAGTLRLLGADLVSISVLVSEHGLTFDISYQVNPILHVDLHGSFTSLTNLNAGGAIAVGVNRSLDLGTLGSLQVNTTINGTLAIGYTGGDPSATFQGGFVFQSIQCNIPTVTLDAHGPALQNIDDTLWNQVTDIISKLLKNADQWLIWVHGGIIHGAGQAANQIGHILASIYQLSPNDIASKTQQILGYDITNTAEALRGAGATANQAASALKYVGYQAEDIGKVIASVFTNTHADTNIGHTDIPAGPHVNVAATHVDVPRSHIDTTNHTDVPRSHIDTTNHIDIPGTHTDSNTLFGHIDHSLTPHGDSNPHADQTTTPHGDSNPHADQTTTPHTDTNSPHVDSQTPPHGDTNTHVDVNT